MPTEYAGLISRKVRLRDTTLLVLGRNSGEVFQRQIGIKFYVGITRDGELSRQIAYRRVYVSRPLLLRHSKEAVNSF